jgi:hypothetical protein
MFQANCHLALTGVDLASGWRNTYVGYRQGLRLMRASGYRNPKSFVQGIATPVSPGEVMTGDLCFIGNSGCVFSGSVVLGIDSGGRGLVIHEMTAEVEVYRVVSKCQH